MGGKDDFFSPDCTRSWWGSLPHPKAFYMFGNAPHRSYAPADSTCEVTQLCTTPDYADIAEAFVSGVLLGEPTPTVDWSIDLRTGDTTARQVSNHTPINV